MAEARLAIEEEHRRLDEEHGGGHAKKLAELESRKTKAQEASANLEAHGRDWPALKKRQEVAEQKLKSLQSEGREKQQAIRSSRTRLNELHGEGPQRSGFPNNMKKLLDAIGTSRGFQKQPLGPIGQYVHLKQPVWSKVLERSFGSTLNGFIVTSKGDQDCLMSIMKMTGW